MICRFACIGLVCASLLTGPAYAESSQVKRAPTLNLNLPSMGAVAGTDLSVQEEQMIGEQMMQHIRADSHYLNDADTIEYLNRLGYRLVSVANSHTYNFYFFPIIDKSLNAFAMPGGFIAVHSGTIIAAQNESELAGVIAHEIGHVSQRHIARMIDEQRHAQALSIGTVLLALLAARAGSGDAAAAMMVGGQAAMIQKQLGFSRNAEREADRVGLSSLINAGFNPLGMQSFFNRLMQNNHYYEAAAPQYLLTHPLSVDRLSDMENRTRNMPRSHYRDSLDFYLIQQRLRVLQEKHHHDFLRVQNEMRLSLKSGVNDAQRCALLYGLSLINAKLKNGENALRYAQEALRASPEKNNTLVLKNYSEQLFQFGSGKDREKALKTAKKLTQDNPLSTTAALLYADQLFGLKRYQETLQFMRNQEALGNTQPMYFSVLAQCYKALNQRSQHHQAIGDMYLAQGDKKAAEYQYQLAQRANDGNFYTMSQVDAKLRSTRALILEDEKFRTR